MKPTPLIFSALLLYQGCASPKIYTEPAEVTANSVAFEDKYAGTKTVAAPWQFVWGDAQRQGYQLRAVRDIELRYRLTLQLDARNWKFLDTARDADALPLDVTVVDRRVMYGGDVRELLWIWMDRSYLTAASIDDGLDIKVYGRRGTEIVKVNAAYIGGFLDKVNEGFPAVGNPSAQQ